MPSLSLGTPKIVFRPGAVKALRGAPLLLRHPPPLKTEPLTGHLVPRKGIVIRSS